MTEPTDYETLFLNHLAHIDKALAATSRVLGFRGDDAEEFLSWGRERLWSDNYALLRKWRGQSKLTTYLSTVILNLGRDFRVKRWGRWRPSAAAVDLGPLAVRLEKLIYRDGCSLTEAAQLLRARSESTLSDRQLADLLAKVPHRERPRRVDEQDVPIETVDAGSDADLPLDEAEADIERRKIHLALAAAMAKLDPEEQIVIKMHFTQGRSLADVARALDTPQKPLYRVKNKALRLLRDALESAGITWERVSALFGGALAACDDEVDIDASSNAVDEQTNHASDGENGIPRPSKKTSGPSSPIEARNPPEQDRSERMER